MNRLTTVVFVTALLVDFQTANGVDFHVAPDGDDTHPGTEAEPFATLERVRDAVRELKQAAPLAEPATIFVKSGNYHLTNNIFIDCQRALGSAPWNDQRWKQAVDGGAGCLWHERLLEEVDITKPPYTTRYPELVGFMKPLPGQVRVNRAKNNVLIRCDQTSSGNWKYVPEHIWVTDADPGFADAAGGNYQLRPDSAVFQHLPGFLPIPFDKMGPSREQNTDHHKGD